MTKGLYKSDDELLREFQQGDRHAYEAIYERYWQLLFRFSRKMLHDESVAKDVVQEVFATFWTKIDQAKIQPPLAAYLYTLTRNKILDLIRRSKVEDKYLDSLKQVMQLSEAMPDRMYIEKELYDLIEQEIKNLPEKMRIVFDMSRREYKSTQQIADELGLSQQTVKNQISTAIKTLKKKLGDSIHIYLTFF